MCCSWWFNYNLVKSLSHTLYFLIGIVCHQGGEVDEGGSVEENGNLPDVESDFQELKANITFRGCVIHTILYNLSIKKKRAFNSHIVWYYYCPLRTAICCSKSASESCSTGSFLNASKNLISLSFSDESEILIKKAKK